jgi:hypothetical protein
MLATLHSRTYKKLLPIILYPTLQRKWKTKVRFDLIWRIRYTAVLDMECQKDSACQAVRASVAEGCAVLGKCCLHWTKEDCTHG